MTFCRNIQNTPEQSLYASFSCRFAFCINFSTFKPDTKNNAIFYLHSIKKNVPTLMRCNFLTHTPKLIIFGTHNLQTFKYNILISELLLMQFCSYLIFVLNCITGSDEIYASHCCELSQLHQPADAVLHPSFI